VREVGYCDTTKQTVFRPWLLIVAVVISLLFFACGSGSQPASAQGKKRWLSKVDHDLTVLFKENETFLQGGSAGAFKSSNPYLRVVDGLVVIDAVASGEGKDLLADLEALGLQNGATFGRMVSGQLPIEAIDDLAGLDSLKFARPAYASTHGKSPKGGGAVVGQDRQIKP
jgi:hypothetical protein